MGRTPKAQLKKRRSQVKKMLVRGVTQEKMAEQLDVTRRTVARDVKHIKEEIKDKIKEEPIEEVLTDLEATLDILKQEYWKIYHDKEATNSVKLRALKSINESVENRIKLLQKLGVVREEPDKLEIKEGYEEKLRETYNDLLEDLDEED